MVGARVTGKEPGNWFDIFVIDKGSKHGLERYMAVLKDGALIGKLFEVGESYSKVISIVEDTSVVAVQSSRTTSRGYLRGDSKLKLDGLCIMDSIDMKAEIVVGDEIVTSDLSVIYPPGITVGIVREIKTDVKGLSKIAIVEPAVDFRQYIDMVLVINQTFEKNISEFIEVEDER